MLSELQLLALDYVHQELGGGKAPRDLMAWFHALHEQSPMELYRLLPEPDNNVPRVYKFRADDFDPELVILEVEDHIPGNEHRYPFIKVSANDPYFGVSFKRTNGKEGPTPKPTKVQNSIKGWQEIRDAGERYSPLFGHFVQLAERPKIRIEGQEEVHTVPARGCKTVIGYAAKFLIQEKESVFVSLSDPEGNYPGTVEEYRHFIVEGEVAARYESKDVGVHHDGSCSLCGANHVDIYAQGAKGAGFNLMNQDRAGAFSNSDKDGAWKKFAICLPCCRLLTVAKWRVLPTLQTKIAGTSAIVIPSLGQDLSKRRSFMRQIRDDYDKMIHPNTDKDEGGATQIEKGFVEGLTENQKALTSMSILWGSFGQDIGDVKAVVRDIVPGRLSDLSDLNAEVEAWDHPVFPDPKFNDFRLRLTLGMGCLRKFFSRVADQTQEKNHPDNSTQMFNFKRAILEAVYQGLPLRDVRGLEEEIHVVIKQHYSVNYQDESHFYSDMWTQGKKPSSKRVPFTTIAGWAKHVARLLHYLRKVGVLTMNEPYVPFVPELAQYVGPETGIDSAEKAFAFWLGVLQGHVMRLQKDAGRQQSAVNWLKHLELRSRDLPELYTKQYGKLVRLDQENKVGKVLSWPYLQSITEEISRLGLVLGGQIKLTVAQTNYFLVLGMGVSRNVWWMSPKTKAKTKAKAATTTNPDTIEEAPVQ